MLMGFDDGISVPILNDCLVGDLTKNEGETVDQFRARRNGTALKRGEDECKARIPVFEKKSQAVRHCETNGCTTIVHDETGKFLTKPWGAMMGSTQMITKEGVTTSMATSIDRTQLGVLPAPLCRFCDVPGLPTSFGKVQRDNCCRCGGGEFRRFFTAPLYRLINPLEPHQFNTDPFRDAPPGESVEIINTGTNYKVGDLLRVASTAVPNASGAVVRVTKVHDPPVNKISVKEGMTCEDTCQSYGTRCMSQDCGVTSGECMCAQPGDMREKGGIQTIEVVNPGENYESGAPLYRLVGGSGAEATLRIHSVDIGGGITYTPSFAASSVGVIAAVSVAALGAVVSGGLLYGGYKKSAVGALFVGAVVALVVGLVVKPAPQNKPGTRKSVKSPSACAEGEKLNEVTGACEDESIQLTRLRKITDHY